MALKLVNQLSGKASAYFSYASIHRGLGRVHHMRGHTDAAREEFQKSAHIGSTSPDGEKPFSTYELACALAQCSTVVGNGKAQLTAAEQADKRRYAEQAIRALKEAIAGGWENLAWMKQDPELDALRDRDDFKKVLTDLEETNRQ
jgi:hypothetical protein